MLVLRGEVQSHIYRIYDSIADVNPVDWQRFAGEDLCMDPRLIRMLAETLADQCRMWVMMVADPVGSVVACACLCLFAVDAVLAAPPTVRKITEFIRACWPGFLKFDLLFCGLPLPAKKTISESHPMRITERCSPPYTMRRLARKYRARMMMFKEFGVDRKSELAPLERLGYVCGDVPPAYDLPGNFRSFDEYRSALKARSRRFSRGSCKRLGGDRTPLHRPGA